MRQVLLFCALLLTATHHLSAAESQSRTIEVESPEREAGEDSTYSPNWPEPPNTAGMLLRLGFGTVITLGLCVGTMVLGKRWLQRQTPHAATRMLKIEESVVIGHRATLFLIKVGDNQLVAGTDAGGLKSLIVLPTAFQDVLDRREEATEPAPADIVPAILGNPNLWRAA